MMGKKDFTTNPYLCLLLDAEEETLIADEFFHISQAYKLGSYGLKVNIQKAIKYNRIAAEHGHAVAQFFEASQQAVQGNMQEALKWMKKSADQGDPRATNNIAISLHRGDYGESKKSEYMKYLQTSAEKEYFSACKRLGLMYLDGIDVEKNIQLARYWLLKAYLNSNDNEILKLLSAHIDKRLINKDRINNHLITTDAAREGCFDALYTQSLGIIKNNEDEGVSCLKKAIEKGSHLGCYDLADYYIRHNININESIDLLNQAASWGDQGAQIRLGQIYWSNSLGVTEDIEKSLYWVQKALSYGSPAARYLFAMMNMSNDLQTILPDNGVMRGMNYMEMAAKDKFEPATEFFKSMKMNKEKM